MNSVVPNDHQEVTEAKGGKVRIVADPSLLDQVLGYQLRVSYSLMRRYYHESFRDVDITNVEFGLLLIVAAHRGCAQGEASRLLGTPATVAVGAVNTLVERGLIARSRSKADRRAYVLELTEVGDALVRDGLHRTRIAQAQILDGLNKAERATLEKCFRTIQDNLRSMLGDA